MPYLLFVRCIRLRRKMRMLPLGVALLAAERYAFYPWKDTYLTAETYASFGGKMRIFGKPLSLRRKTDGIMVRFKYQLCPKGTQWAAGVTDLKAAVGLILETNELTLLQCTEGMAVVSMNFRRQTLRKGDLVILFPDIVCSVERTSSMFSARFLSFSAEPVEEIYYKISSISFWDFVYQNPVCRLNKKQRKLLEVWYVQAKWIVEESVEEYRLPLLRNHLFNLFAAMDSELKRHPDYLTAMAKRDRSWTLLAEFTILIGKHCHEQREVNFYADRLCITADYLYKLTYRTMQMTPKQVIDQQTLIEIKSYLANTDLPIKSIAEAMHYEDASYLCRFFRRMTGMSPLQFRKGK